MTKSLSMAGSRRRLLGALLAGLQGSPRPRTASAEDGAVIADASGGDQTNATVVDPAMHGHDRNRDNDSNKDNDKDKDNGCTNCSPSCPNGSCPQGQTCLGNGTCATSCSANPDLCTEAGPDCLCAESGLDADFCMTGDGLGSCTTTADCDRGQVCDRLAEKCVAACNP
jgi:hypothetical protein